MEDKRAIPTMGGAAAKLRRQRRPVLVQRPVVRPPLPPKPVLDRNKSEPVLPERGPELPVRRTPSTPPVLALAAKRGRNQDGELVTRRKSFFTQLSLDPSAENPSSVTSSSSMSSQSEVREEKRKRKWTIMEMNGKEKA